MQWVAISGSWRTIDDKVEKDVRQEVAEIIRRGDGIVTGGALGVDFIATEAALKHDPSAKKIKIILPTSLEVYARHFLTRADEGVITHIQAQRLVDQLRTVKDKNPAALVEMSFDVCNQSTYYARNQAVIDAANTLSAFQVNGSQGTQDAINKARACGMAVKRKSYTIPLSPKAGRNRPHKKPRIR